MLWIIVASGMIMPGITINWRNSRIIAVAAFAKGDGILGLTDPSRFQGSGIGHGACQSTPYNDFLKANRLPSSTHLRGQ